MMFITLLAHLYDIDLSKKMNESINKVKLGVNNLKNKK